MLLFYIKSCEIRVFLGAFGKEARWRETAFGVSIGGLVLRWFLLPLSSVQLCLLKGISLPIYGVWVFCLVGFFYGPVTSLQPVL